MKNTLLFTTVSVLAMGICAKANAYDLTADDLGQSANIKWEEVNATGTDIITVHLPDGDKYFKYTYIKPDNYQKVTGEESRVVVVEPNGIINLEDVTNRAFEDIASTGTDISSSARGGGVIFNNGNNATVDITSDFIGNKVETMRSNGESANGGAIYNAENAKLGNITGDFINNSTKAYYSSFGGAVYNAGEIGNITGNFIGNRADSESGDIAYVGSAGGAIYNSGKIKNIKGDFIGNTAKMFGGAIVNNGEILTISGNFLSNFSLFMGSVYNTGTISEINQATFKGNSSLAGGALYNENTIGHIKADFIENQSMGSAGGALINDGAITEITGNFTGNYVTDYLGTSDSMLGGAIYNSGTIDNILNSTFKNNYLEGGSGSTGGAIYSTEDIKITADNGKSEFTGNYVLIKGTEATEDQKIPNAIYMDSKSSTLTLNALSKGEILFNDEIDGSEGYKIALTGDNTGTITFNNHIRNANITLENTNLVLGNAGVFADNSSLVANSGTLTLASLGTGDRLTAKSIELNNVNLNIANADVDLQGRTMGQIDHDILTNNGGEINIDKFTVLNDGEAIETAVAFAGGVDNYAQAALSPVYQYRVAYNAETGEFVFVRGDKIIPDPLPSTPTTPIVPIRPAYKAFNPGVFANDVASMSGLNMQGGVAKQVFDLDTNREYCFGRVWATPYYSDDTLSFSNFYDVDSRNYGLIAGIDTRAFGNPDGWNSVYTLFGAYNDGENKYQGVKVDSKSWLVGLKASVYNGGFYGDALMNYAWHDSDQTTAFGKDSVDSTGYGAALKAGYKFDMNRMSVDTSAMLSWQEVQGEDFTSKSGAKISTDDYNRLTLTPQVKLGYSFEHVKPYALVRYNFVLDEDGSSTVNNIALPTIESKDYVEYGLGVETTDAFPHGGYAHVLRHDGGRSGWSVTAGYRFNF